MAADDCGRGRRRGWGGGSAGITTVAGFVDGSGWQGVYDHLTADGYRVAVVQNPTHSGESVSALIADPPPGAPVPPILPPQDGFLFLDRERFAASFAADVPENLAAFMADSQVPWGVEALEGAISEPAWQTKPSWYLVATDDRMIPPAAQRTMSERAGATVTETPGSHAVYVSRPAVVAAVITQAAQGVNGQA
ncbi:alpha/beta fold hydrolase [Streptomyces sp. NPDC001903]|uniref:alpha/beta fold hydrolase n=1 Tax=Streptomyces sp. NPDC001903 TaxID=3364622 RepID=UPI0036C816BB